MNVKTRKKLIEVALPLDAINKASAREKSIRHGHPSTLHLWWARRPLAAARAVIFAQMVDDPSEYVEVLRGDAKLRRRAESILKERKKKWAEAKKYAESMGADASHPGPGPGPGPEPTLDDILAEIERERLFKIIEDLVQWENTTNETVLQRARDEIWQSWRRACADNADHPRAKELFDRHKLPAFHDPFAGGGALPLEAQRLGLEAYASDLNPVAVLINKAMIEIPPKFAGRPPVNPESRQNNLFSRGGAETQRKEKAHRSSAPLREAHWRGAQGLAEDVRYYGKWMRDEAEKRIGHLYPKFKVTAEIAKERKDLEKYVGRELTVIAWLWARTVKSPNPAFRDVEVPLASTFLLSTKKGKEAWVEVVTANERAGGEVTANERELTRMKDEKKAEDSRPLASIGGSRSAASIRGYEFVVKTRASHGAPPAEAKAGTKLGRGANFQCVMSGTPIAPDYIKAEGKAGRMGARLMAIVAEGDRGRVYLAPTPEHEAAALKAKPEWKPEGDVPARLTGGTCVPYGLSTWGDLFTPRQLVALTTFSDLVGEAMQRIRQDALAAGLPDDDTAFREGGTGAKAYAEAVGVYLGFGASRAVDAWSSIVTWRNQVEASRNTFARQALPMTWDFTEVCPFSTSCGNWTGNSVDWVEKSLLQLPNGLASGSAAQADAATQSLSVEKVVSTDPPYYDNIGYADLSDFFYVWLRRTLRAIIPDLCATMAVPKAEELVATPYRHGSKEKAESFFLTGMTDAMHRLAEQTHPAFPVTIYYAFKQSETEGNSGTASTGWETFLDAVIRAGFGTSGTWPMRTEKQGRVISNDTNALASSIVLVCRPRPADAPTATRREFVAALQRELPAALRRMQAGNIAPVDLAQAAIGPGMAVFTRYAKVLDARGNALTVREALALINETLDAALAEQEGEFDADSRWALAWFEQHGFDEGEFGVAETLSKAKNTSVEGMVQGGILQSARGRVRLLRPEELPVDWSPETDERLTNWETVHHLIRVLATGGESAAADLVKALGAKAETARELAYRLYTLCERKKRAAEALAYNGLVQSWPELTRLARESAAEHQPELF